MKLNQEIKVVQTISFKGVVMVTSLLFSVIAIITFFMPGFFSSVDSNASNSTITAGATVKAKDNPFSSLSSGDTIFVYGKFRIDADYDMHNNKAICIYVDGSSAQIQIEKDNVLHLGNGSSIILVNGAEVKKHGGGACSDKFEVLFDGSIVAHCSGDASNSIPSFSDINSAGGIDASGIILPVSWLEVSAKATSDNEVEMRWSTGTEENNSHFEIEHSQDGVNWDTYSHVDSKGDGGFSTDILTYSSYVNVNPISDKMYFRLKQIDYDGKYDYSIVVLANFEIKVPVRIGTLGNNRISVSVEDDGFQGSDVNIFNMAGSMIRQQHINQKTEFELPKAGVYIIEVLTGNDVQRIKHLVR